MVKLKAGQKWKTRHGNIVTVKPTVLWSTDYFETDEVDGNAIIYNKESEDGVFYVFDADLLNGQDLVELVSE